MVWPLDHPLLVLLIFLPPLLLLIRRRISAANHHLPPGPPGWPAFGNMFQLSMMPHRTLAQLRNKYGPVIWLRIGAINTIAILSAKTAAEFFKNHDLAFADRRITETMRVHNFDKASLALAPYGSYWRFMRRLVTVEMFTAKRINDTALVQRRCVDDMVDWIAREASKLEERQGLQVARFVFSMTFNLFGNLVLSRDLFDPESEDGSEFFTATTRLIERTGVITSNVADFFPWLGRLDPLGLRRKMGRDLGKSLEIASKFVKERMEERQGECMKIKRDLLDVLLEYKENGNEETLKFSNEDVNIFILEIFVAGTDTTTSTIEWALTELLSNPGSLTKAKDELTQVVGPNRKVEESDIENLPYLQAVIKETFRLHPPVPFLIPRKAIQDTNFGGYFIPKDTQVLVNTWAIGRDPDVWEDPQSFKPERFIGSKIDYKGQHYELIPFGAGRRMCVGVPLAHRLLHLILSSLLHRFDWELDRNVTPATVDMKERFGLGMKKIEPLLAVPKVVIT